jgi:hypothetical protein
VIQLQPDFNHPFFATSRDYSNVLFTLFGTGTVFSMKRGFLKSKLLSPEQVDSQVQKESVFASTLYPTLTDILSRKLCQEIPSGMSDSDAEPCADGSKFTIRDLRALPASLVAKAGKRRFVCREWPRNPEGLAIYATPEGKRAPNGLKFWGA